jgi:hypothetical protein
VANLLHRLLRPRSGRETERVQGPPIEPLEQTQPEPVADAETAESTLAATPKPAGKGPRKTRDEVSSIGPGEP